MIRLALPVCPSTNNLYVQRRFGRGRAKSPAYEEWIERAGWTAKVQFPQPIHGPVAVTIAVPFNRRRDIDNIKPVLDLLKTLGLIDDDRWVDRLVVERVAAGDMVVTVEATTCATRG